MDQSAAHQARVERLAEAKKSSMRGYLYTTQLGEVISLTVHKHYTPPETIELTVDGHPIQAKMKYEDRSTWTNRFGEGPKKSRTPA